MIRIINPKKYENELLKLLWENEKEFSPDLNEEEWGLKEEQDIDRMTDKEVVTSNFYSIFYGENRKVVAAFKDFNIVGFLVFDTDFRHDDLPKKMNPCNFVLLTLVDREHRREGIAKEMNRIMAKEENLQCNWIARRTQKVNETSQKYIESMGFDEISRSQEQGNEQIYYGKKVDEFNL